MHNGLQLAFVMSQMAATTWILFGESDESKSFTTHSSPLWCHTGLHYITTTTCRLVITLRSSKYPLKSRSIPSIPTLLLFYVYFSSIWELFLLQMEKGKQSLQYSKLETKCRLIKKLLNWLNCLWRTYMFPRSFYPAEQHVKWMFGKSWH